MQFLHDSIAGMRLTVLKRSLASWFVAGALAAVSIGVTACGSSVSRTTSSRSSVGTTVSFVSINTEKIEHAIENSSLAQRGKHVTVICPSRVQQEKGLVFYCTAIYRTSRTPFMVTELNGSGDVHYVAR